MTRQLLRRASMALLCPQRLCSCFFEAYVACARHHPLTQQPTFELQYSLNTTNAFVYANLFSTQRNSYQGSM